MTRCKEWLIGVLLVAATVVAYQPVWHAGFIWDDDQFLTNNPFIKAGNGLYRLWFTASTPDYFPLTSSALWLEWRLWGEHALGYHLVNILLHALSAVLLWRVLLRLKIPGAWIGAGLFAVHPVNVESVAWITERKNTLCLFFYLCAVLAWVKYEDNGTGRWYGWALVAFALSLLSKTAAAPLPVVLLGLAWWRRGRVAWQDVKRTMPFFALAAVLAAVTVWFQYHLSIGQEVVRSDSVWSRLAGAGWAVWFYMYKTVWPVDLIFVYPRWQIDAHNMLSYVPLLLLIVVFAVLWHYRRRWGKELLCALSYDVLLLLPVLGFLNIYFMKYSLVADHWQYFAIIGPLALAGAALARRPVIAAAILLALCALTWKQCGTYANAETLWRATVRQDPDSWVGLCELSNILLGEGRLDEAVACAQKAVDLKPDYSGAQNNLALALFQQGHVDEAVDHYQKALAASPGNAPAHSNYGNALARMGRIDEAISQYEQAINIRPDFDSAHNNLADVLWQKGKVDEAIAQYQQALEINPNYVEARVNLGTVLFHAGRTADAIAQFEKALELRPNDPLARSGLDQAMAKQHAGGDANSHN